MQINTVADLMVETLIQAGVKRIFGVVGDSPVLPHLNHIRHADAEPGRHRLG